MSMVSTLLGKRTKFKFQIIGTSLDTGVASFQVNEAISTPYRVSLELACEDDISFEMAIGKEALLTIESQLSDRKIHGVINGFSRVGKKGRFILYEATVVPQIWFLSQRQDSRIFQQESVKDIVTKVLRGAQIPADRFEFRLQGAYQPKEYCVQYQETDLAFISRLLEAEGIWYFFEQTKDNVHKVVFADGRSAYKPAPHAESLMFRTAGGNVALEEAVYTLTAHKTIGPDKICQNDFNFNNPSAPLKTEEELKNGKGLEIYEYPGCYEDSDTGQKLAKIRLHEKTGLQEIYQGMTTTAMLAPGFTFNLKNHETRSFNQELYLLVVTQSGSQPGVYEEAGQGQESFSSQFTAIPSKNPFRPARVTPKPVIIGTQTAIVVGPKGEEIYTNNLGQVKVKFPWDRSENKDEKSSCWIRVAQVWAGAGWGGMQIPRIGQEVIVSFLEGDPDRPIITGRVYNGANPVPHGLPGSKNVSTIKSNSTPGGGGSNEMSFDDSKGSEKVTVHAQKDMNVATENDKSQTVGNNETLSVGQDRTKTVGKDENITITQNRTTIVGANETTSITQNENHTVAAAQTVSVGGSKSESVGGTSTENVALIKALTVGGALQMSVGGAINETVGAMKSEQVGGAKSVMVGLTMSEKVVGSRSMTTGKEMTVKAKQIVMEAEDSITIKTGSAVIKMSKNGDIEITGKNIKVKGSGDVSVKGQKIGEN